MIMKRNINKLLLPAIAVALFSFAACSDWIEPESLDIKNPSLEEQNPELYAQYLEALRSYKAGEHKAVFVEMENPTGAAPASQPEHLTALPDSVDYIVLNNPDDLHPALVAQFAEVRKKHTRVLYKVDFSTLETAWNELVKADATLSEEDALVYLEQQMRGNLALSDKYGFDGVIVCYTGRTMASLKDEDLETYGARQLKFTEAVTSWRTAHSNQTLAFMGRADNLLEENRTLLSSCNYLIVPTSTAVNESDIAVKVLQVLTAGVPTDRIIVTAMEVQPDDKDKVFGYFGTYDANGDKIRALYGTAVWATLTSENYTRAGMYVTDIRPDYYNRTLIYPHLREAISIMNPSPKN